MVASAGVGFGLGLGFVAWNAEHLGVVEGVGSAGCCVGDVVAFEWCGAAVCAALGAAVVVSGAGLGGDFPPLGGAGAAWCAVGAVGAGEGVEFGVLGAVAGVADELVTSGGWALSWCFGHAQRDRVTAVLVLWRVRCSWLRVRLAP